jgi:hypothetical protein
MFLEQFNHLPVFFFVRNIQHAIQHYRIMGVAFQQQFDHFTIVKIFAQFYQHVVCARSVFY